MTNEEFYTQYEEGDRRVLITFDGNLWFIRHVCCVTYDLDRGEQSYRCNGTIGGAFPSIHEAVAALPPFLKNAD